MASKEERELDALFTQLRATQAPPRDEASERARRLAVSRAVERRAHAHGHPPVRTVRRVPFAAWTLGGIAAALLLVVPAATLFRRADVATVEPERLQATERARAAATPVPATASPADPPPRTQPEQRPLTPRPTGPSHAPSAVAPAISGATPSVSANPSGASAAADASGASLAAQNELFQSAVRAARRGDDEVALREFDRLLQQYPTSPLAADSLVRKFRTLTRLGRAAESARTAREYLARYPEGFAAGEAEKLLSTAPADVDSANP